MSDLKKEGVSFFSKQSEPAPVPAMSKDIKEKVFQIDGKGIYISFEQLGLFKKEVKVSCESEDGFSKFCREFCSIRPNMASLWRRKTTKSFEADNETIFWGDIQKLQDKCLGNTPTPTPSK